MFYKGRGAKFLIGILFLSLFVFPTGSFAASAFTSVTVLTTSTPDVVSPELGGGGWSDRTFPEILDVRVKIISDSRVQIEWDVSEEAESYIAYGFTNNFEIQEYHLRGYFKTHAIILDELVLDKKYQFRIIALDRGGNPVSAFNYFLLKTRLPFEIPIPLSYPLPFPFIPREPELREQPVTPESPVPLSLPPVTAKRFISQRELAKIDRDSSKKVKIISDAEPETLILPREEKKESPGVKQIVTKKEIKVPKENVFADVKFVVKSLYDQAVRRPFLLIPNKMFSVPDMAYGPFLVSLVLFVLSLIF